MQQLIACLKFILIDKPKNLDKINIRTAEIEKRIEANNKGAISFTAILLNR